MKLTPFGKRIRTLRLDNGTRLLDLAEAVGVSPSFISAIESGRKAPTDAVVSKVASYFDLTDVEIAEFKRLADQSINEVRIDLRSSSKERKEVAAAFARKFSSLNHVDMEQLLKLIGQKKG